MERFVFNECVYLGSNSRSCLLNELESKNYSKVLFVTDKTIINNGILDKVTSVLNGSNIEYFVFDDIKPNPTVENVTNGLQALNESSAQVIIAVGGGSVIDTAKAIAVVATNKEHKDIISLDGVVNTKNRCYPLIAMPTTAGTAAEATINYVITDTIRQKKMVCVDPNDIPYMAIIDAELMKTMPKSITASTGMDALTHAIESLITKSANDFSDMFAIQAIKTIAQYLYPAYIDGNDMTAREKMAFSQYVVGMGFSNVGLGICHSMAHPLGGRFDIAHGVANAVLLPTVMEYNAESPSKPKYRIIAECFGVETKNLTDDECVVEAINAVKNLSKQLNIPQTLSELGIKKQDIKQLSIDAYNDICTSGNPRSTSSEAIQKLYESLI